MWGNKAYNTISMDNDFLLYIHRYFLGGRVDTMQDVNQIKNTWFHFVTREDQLI